MEESGEVVTAASKWVGLGLDKVDHWDGTNMKTRLEDEIADAIAAFRFVREELDLDRDRILARANEKLELYREWHADPNN